MGVHLSIVIPAFNESAILPETLSCLQRYIAAQPFSAEVIVVDDGSSDDTPRVLQEFSPQFGESLRVLRHDINRGKGASIRSGIRASAGEYVLFTDADLPAQPDDFSKLLAPLYQGKSIAIASRTTLPEETPAATSVLRLAASKFYRRAVKIILGMPLRDTQCGFKAVCRESVLHVLPHLCQSRYSFDAEFLFVAWQYGLSIDEVDIQVVERRDAIRHAILFCAPQMFLDLFRIRFGAPVGFRTMLRADRKVYAGVSR
jgi:dolichyl-phosphate beta-glucosyltransferase